MKRFLKTYQSILFTVWMTTACTQLLPQKPATTTSNPVYAIAIRSGNYQSATARTQIPQSLVATVTDTSINKVVNNVHVTWSVVSGGGNLLNQYTMSDFSGQVASDFLLGATAGPNSVKATLDNGQSVTYNLTAVVGSPSTVTSSISGTSPHEPDGVDYSSVTITLKDVNNNAISGTIPSFTASGSGNVVGACSTTNSSGVSTCTLKSTVGETKILSITSPFTPPVTDSNSVVFASGAVSSANSTISVSGGPVIANGTASATVTITLKDANNAAVGGITPTFSATNTGTTNSYGTCSSSSNVTGISTCTFTSTHAEVKTVLLTSPVSLSGNTVTFTAGPPSNTTSTITGTGPMEPNGTSTSAITITLEDVNGNPISGTVPTFSATNTGNTNVYGPCSSSATNGVSNCTLASTVAETKTLSITSPVSVTGGTVVFAPGAVSAAHSTITGTGPVIADGVATSTITITLKDASNVAVGGVTPTFGATNTSSGNSMTACSSSDASTGISTCTLSSTVAETKTLSLTSPVSLTGGTVSFIAGSAANTSTITGTTSIVADGATTSTVTITLLDAKSNPISGVVPQFTATDTGSANRYNACSSSSASGVSTCTFTSTKAEVKTLSITTPTTVAGGTVTFIHGSPSIATSTIVGSSPVEPDGSSQSTITITLLDQYNNPVNASTPTFNATDTGTTNVYGACSASTTSGVSTCTLTSTHPETKTLSLLTPIAMSGGTVTFVAGAASSLHTTITGTTSITANGSATSTVTVTLKDAANQAIVGVVPTFNATNTGGGNVYGTCSLTSATGVSTCSLASTHAETKTLQLVSPISLTGGTVTFVHGNPSSTTSQITGTGPITANGSSTSTITLVLYDANDNPISGVTPTVSASGSNNTISACGSTSATGSSTCTLSSTHAEVKTLSIATPISVSGGTVGFVAGAASASNSTIVGSGPVTADGISTSTITITLLDTNLNPVIGTTPTFSATGSNNTSTACSSSNSSGVSTCTLKSTTAETKTLSLLTPASVSGGSVSFVAGTAVAGNSSISGSGPVNADGTSSSTITISLKDTNHNPVSGSVPTFSATNTGSSNSYGTCSSSDASGNSTCTLKSMNAETKTLSITSPVSLSGGTVVFNQAASAAHSTITGSGPVPADGTSSSTITITILDYASNGISGVTPTFTATNTSSGNTYGSCSSTNGSGVSTCSMQSTSAETKTLYLSSPVNVTGGTVIFY